MLIRYDATTGKILAMFYETGLWPVSSDPTVTLDNTTWADVWNNPQNYLIQNGAPVSNPTPKTGEKQEWLQSTMTQKVAQGFPSSADGTSRVYAMSGIDSSGMTPMQKWTGILTLIAAGMGQTSYTIKDLTGNTVTLTQAEFKSFAADGFATMNGLEATMWVKEAQIKACITQAELNTIGWPNPNPPSVPTGLAGIAGTQEVTLSWAANTDVTMIGSGGYNVYQAGTKVNASLVTSTTYTASGLTTGTSYSFSISAVDTDGNESAQCAPITVTAN